MDEKKYEVRLEVGFLVGDAREAAELREFLYNILQTIEEPVRANKIKPLDFVAMLSEPKDPIGG